MKIKFLQMIFFCLITTSTNAQWILAGSEVLHLKFLFFPVEVYKIDFFVTIDQKKLLPDWQKMDQIKLEFIYSRDVEKKYLEQAWSEGLSDKFQNEKKQIITATPSMKKAEKLVMIKNKDSFILEKDSVTLLTIKNKEFAAEVLGIWLAFDGKFPHIAQSLTNNKPGERE